MGLHVILRMQASSFALRPLVLIVEDEPDLCELLAFALELHGFAVETAPDGEAALRLVTGGPSPAAALIDLRMPRMDGAQLVAHLRRQERCARMTLAFVTAEPERARHLGLPVFAKPVPLDELLAYLEASVP